MARSRIEKKYKSSEVAVICTVSHLSSVRSCTSSTITCVTPLRSVSPSSLLSNTPVVQYSSLVADD